MLKWFKEVFVDSIKEGMQEAREEMAAEAAEKTAKEKQFKEKISFIPKEELFYLAVSAPFRCAALREYVSFFSIDEEESSIRPRSLYQMGERSEEEKKKLFEVLERDFGAVDKESAQKALRIFQATFRLTEDLETTPAFQGSIIFHLAIASYEVGFFTKEEAMQPLKEMGEILKEKYHSWEEFGADFLHGDDINNLLGKKFLKGIVKNLTICSGSPWNYIEIGQEQPKKD